MSETWHQFFVSRKVNLFSPGQNVHASHGFSLFPLFAGFMFTAALTVICRADTNQLILSFTNRAGRVYQGVRIVSVQPNAFCWTSTNQNTSDGGRIPFKDVQADVQAALGYDAAKAADYEAMVANQKARQLEAGRVAAAAAVERARAKQLQKAAADRLEELRNYGMIIDGEVVQKVEGGLFVDSFTERQKREPYIVYFGGEIDGEHYQVYVGLCFLTEYPRYNEKRVGEHVRIVGWPSENGTNVTGSPHPWRTFTADFARMKVPSPAEKAAMRGWQGKH